ncbi:AraC family transcriptional regulator [Vibrio kyushuensis]|uniref:AraC family transcriptional regulator n=1 Tax=Vibrio kyushuensis TaxID=2910249 RepID=UPI003D14000E
MNSACCYALNRIEAVIEHIDSHLDETLSVSDLSAVSCWSRWQLQRVFQTYTGMSVAQYVREQKLSKAAEQVLRRDKKMVDIAYQYGFGSEVAFSRTFSAFFGISPKRYQQRGTRDGIKGPCERPILDFPNCEALTEGFFQVRIEHASEQRIYGVKQRVRGLLSSEPDFNVSVPCAWNEFKDQCSRSFSSQTRWVGVIDAQNNADEGELTYLAGTDNLSDVSHKAGEFESVVVEENDFAVLPFSGQIKQFAQAVEWLVLHWLPSSGYTAVEAPELEIYSGQSDSQSMNIEYWLPIQKV